MPITGNFSDGGDFVKSLSLVTALRPCRPTMVQNIVGVSNQIS